MFKVNNKNTRTRPEICWKSAIKAPCSSAFIVSFRQANAGWVLEVIYQNVQRKVKKSKHSKVNSSEKNWWRECIVFHCRHKYHPKNYWLIPKKLLQITILYPVKPFVPNVPFLYPLKTSGNCKIYLADIDSHY